MRTSILYAQLLNASTAWISPGRVGRRRPPKLDAESYGWNALYRLYNTAEGWLCIAAFDKRHGSISAAPSAVTISYGWPLCHCRGTAAL